MICSWVDDRDALTRLSRIATTPILTHLSALVRPLPPRLLRHAIYLASLSWMRPGLHTSDSSLSCYTIISTAETNLLPGIYIRQLFLPRAILKPGEFSSVGGHSQGSLWASALRPTGQRHAFDMSPTPLGSLYANLGSNRQLQVLFTRLIGRLQRGRRTEKAAEPLNHLHVSPAGSVSHIHIAATAPPTTFVGCSTPPLPPDRQARGS